MFVLGHLGIGSKLVSPLAGRPGGSRLPRWAIYLGALLPDLIDKPLYYGLSIWTGLHGAELGLISGTRTFGHTAIFTLTLAILAAFRRSRVLAAISLGCASHLVLDCLVDPHATQALLWPFLGQGFPIYPFQGWMDHLGELRMSKILWCEVAGLLILTWDYWKLRNERGLFAQRIKLHLRARRRSR